MSVARLRGLLRRAPAAHLLAGSLCAGLGFALAVRVAHPAPAVAAVALALTALALDTRRTLALDTRRTLALDTRRTLALAFALAAAGWWWGSERLGELDQSILAAEIERAALTRLEVTGPARRSQLAVRVPGRHRLDRDQVRCCGRCHDPLQRLRRDDEHLVIGAHEGLVNRDIAPFLQDLRRVDGRKVISPQPG
jgi:hypothetical protein